MAAPTIDGESVAEKYNLLPKLMPHLDRQLLYPLLNFSPDEDEELSLEKKQVLLELLKPTNMIDFVGNLYKDVHGLNDVPAEYQQKRDQVMQRKDQYEQETSALLGLMSDENVLTSLRSDKAQNLAYLEKEHGVTVQMVEQLYEVAQFHYSLGDYGHAADLLTRYRILVCATSYLFVPL